MKKKFNRIVLKLIKSYLENFHYFCRLFLTKKHNKMAGIGSIIKKLFGSKAERDLKSIQPYVDKIIAIYPSIEKLSNDELRAHTKVLQQKIRDRIKESEEKIAYLKQTVDAPDIDVKTKEKTYDEIDKMEKEIDSSIEDVLLEILPEAFAIVKDTARRFKENEE